MSNDDLFGRRDKGYQQGILPDGTRLPSRLDLTADILSTPRLITVASSPANADVLELARAADQKVRILKPSGSIVVQQECDVQDTIAAVSPGEKAADDLATYVADTYQACRRSLIARYINLAVLESLAPDDEFIFRVDLKPKSVAFQRKNNEKLTATKDTATQQINYVNYELTDLVEDGITFSDRTLLYNRDLREDNEKLAFAYKQRVKVGTQLTMGITGLYDAAGTLIVIKIYGGYAPVPVGKGAVGNDKPRQFQSVYKLNLLGGVFKSEDSKTQTIPEIDLPSLIRESPDGKEYTIKITGSGVDLTRGTTSPISISIPKAVSPYRLIAEAFTIQRSNLLDLYAR